MFKHLNTEKKKKLDDTITCFSIFIFLFFLSLSFCLAITTDDIARHWESSSKSLGNSNDKSSHETWSYTCESNTHMHARTHSKTENLNEKEAKNQQNKADQTNETPSWNASANKNNNFGCNLFLYDNTYACLSKPFKHLCVWIARGHPSAGEKPVPRRKRPRWLS